MTDPADPADPQFLADLTAAQERLERRVWSKTAWETEHRRTHARFFVIQRHLSNFIFYLVTAPLVVVWTWHMVSPWCQWADLDRLDWRVVVGAIFLSGLSARLPLPKMPEPEERPRPPAPTDDDLMPPVTAQP